MKQQLHTPEGVRDIYSVEYEKKLTLQEQLHKVLHLYGYHDIHTPTFEFFDVFRKEIGTIPSKELYKFFDREGNTLVLRPDITPSIARAAATLFEEETLPIRLCYIGNTFINQSSYRGKLKESTQLGAELIGDASAEADAEMLALVIDCLKGAGLEEFQLTVGNVDFFQSMIEDVEMEEEEEKRVRELIANRNYFGLDEHLREIKMKDSTRKAFRLLPELIGGTEILSDAKEIAPSRKALKAIKHLEAIYKILKVYGVEKYITFDLSMSGTHGYYTGIIFRGYTYGTGDAVVKGGRYDHLLEKFGKESPSIGFAIVVDELMNALVRQKIRISYENKNTLVVYEESRRNEAIILAKDFRQKNKNTELLQKDSNKPLEEYMDYGKKNMASSMLFLQDNGQLAVFNLITGERKVITREV